MKRNINLSHKQLSNIIRESVRRVVSESEEYQPTNEDQAISMFYGGINSAISALDSLSKTSQDNTTINWLEDLMQTLVEVKNEFENEF